MKFITLPLLTTCSLIYSMPTVSAMEYRKADKELIFTIISDAICNNIVVNKKTATDYVNLLDSLLQEHEFKLALDVYVFFFEDTEHEKIAFTKLQRYLKEKTIFNHTLKPRLIKMAIQAEDINLLLDLQNNAKIARYKLLLEKVIPHILKKYNQENYNQNIKKNEHKSKEQPIVLSQEELEKTIKDDYIQAIISGNTNTVLDIQQSYEKQTASIPDTFIATHNKQTEVLRLLVGIVKRDVDLKDQNGNTILHHACLNNDINTIKFLVLETEINIQARNKNNKSAFHLAKDNNFKDITNLLESTILAKIPLDTECRICFEELQSLKSDKRMITPCCLTFICTDCYEQTQCSICIK